MIQRKKNVTTLIELIKIFFDRLVTPGYSSSVVQELVPCFYKSVQKATAFCSVLTRIVWEYNFINKMFV